MKFCVKCDNMYYIRINETNCNQMNYYCRNCGHTDENLTNDSIYVMNTQLKKDGQTYNHIINKYTKLDPTLPRIYNVKCPNINCKTNEEKEKEKKAEVIYMRYDDDNMKYLYICVECDTVWKTDDA